MFEHTQVTGSPDSWIALPDGYEPGGSYERVATGASETIRMLRDVEKHIARMSKHPKDAPAKLIVSYSPALAKSHGVIEGFVRSIKKRGEKVGVYCTTTYDARKR